MSEIETILITIGYKSLNVKYNVMQGFRRENDLHLSEVRSCFFHLISCENVRFGFDCGPRKAFRRFCFEIKNPTRITGRAMFFDNLV